MNVKGMSVYEKIQLIRCELLKKLPKLSGRNDEADYDYRELADIIPVAAPLFKKYHLTPIFDISYDGAKDKEYASLTIHDWEDDGIGILEPRKTNQVVFCVPADEYTAENSMMARGGKITYMRRYLYNIALDLANKDTVEPTIKGEKKKKSKEQKEDQPYYSPKDEKPTQIGKGGVTSRQVLAFMDLVTEKELEKILADNNIKSLLDMDLAKFTLLFNETRAKKYMNAKKVDNSKKSG